MWALFASSRHDLAQMFYQVRSRCLSPDSVSVVSVRTISIPSLLNDKFEQGRAVLEALFSRAQ